LNNRRVNREGKNGESAKGQQGGNCRFRSLDMATDSAAALLNEKLVLSYITARYGGGWGNRIQSDL
jgi:hypothetical protein